MTTGKRRRRRKPRQKRRGRWVTRAVAAGVLDVAVRTVDPRRKDLNPGGDLRVLGAIIPCRTMTDPGGRPGCSCIPVMVPPGQRQLPQVQGEGVSLSSAIRSSRDAPEGRCSHNP